MRQVFSSARIENAEAVARLLEAEGIEVRVEHGRSFKRAIRGNFSYRADADNGPKPTVWVIRSDEQPRARQLLREAGLLDAATTLPPTFLPPTPRPENVERAARDAKRKAMRIRFGLLAVILIIAAAIVFKPMPDPAAPGPPRVAAQLPAEPPLGAVADRSVARRVRHRRRNRPPVADPAGPGRGDRPARAIGPRRCRVPGHRRTGRARRHP